MTDYTMLKMSPGLFNVGYVMPDIRLGMGDEHVIVVDDDGNTMPFVHGGFVSRDKYPQLVEVIANAFPESVRDGGVVLPDFRGAPSYILLSRATKEDPNATDD